jgi:hypothetical protein
VIEEAGFRIRAWQAGEVLALDADVMRGGAVDLCGDRAEFTT